MHNGESNSCLIVGDAINYHWVPLHQVQLSLIKNVVDT